MVWRPSYAVGPHLYAMTRASSSHDPVRPESPINNDFAESDHLLERDDWRPKTTNMQMKAGTTLGLIRVWWLAFILNLGGGFLYGYDSGM